MISYVIPTRDRPEELARTVGAIARLGDHAGAGGAEIVVVDNASAKKPDLPTSIAGIGVKPIVLDTNIGAAARNVAARAASGDWLVMLDDDSHPTDDGHLRAIAESPRDVGAVSADISLPDGTRERGGLPEVFIGCGVSIRRELFLSLGGYDPSFDFYAEEYDLCARLIASGSRVMFDPRFRVLHRKVTSGRDFGVILHRLVRNNGWVIARYAPEPCRERATRDMLARYCMIAEREGVMPAFAEARQELHRTLAAQPRTPLSDEMWDRFTGLTAAGEALRQRVPDTARTAAIIEPGKHEEIVRDAVAGLGLIIVGDASHADVRVIGTLSPGPMIDAAIAHRDDPRVIAPWIEIEGEARRLTARSASAA